MLLHPRDVIGVHCRHDETMPGDLIAATFAQINFDLFCMLLCCIRAGDADVGMVW